MQRKDHDLSARLNRLLDVRPAPNGQGQCWLYAQLGLLIFRDGLLDGYRYCEGWTVFADLAFMTIEHGWLEAPDGTVVDPVQPTRDGRYYPGLTFNAAEIQGFMDDEQAGVLQAERLYTMGVLNRHLPYQLAWLRAQARTGVPVTTFYAHLPQAAEAVRLNALEDAACVTK